MSAADVFFQSMATHLQVHVVICADEETLVLHPPLETDQDRFSGLLLQERLWVHGLDLSNRARCTVSRGRASGRAVQWQSALQCVSIHHPSGHTHGRHDVW